MISVILPVYNGERFIREAVESVLQQTFTDFELIIIDDGSTDQTAAILETFDDPRIVSLKNERNEGLPTALNKGIHAARGEWIARMDADDLSLPERFACQMEFLHEHPEVGVLGTAMLQMDAHGKGIAVVEQPATHDELCQKMLADTAMNHATVMMRRTLLVDGYDPASEHAEDTELWSRLIFTTRFANLPDVLYRRRLHNASIMNTRSATQERLSREIRKRLQMRMLGKELPEKRASVLVRLARKIIPAPLRYKIRHLLRKR